MNTLGGPAQMGPSIKAIFFDLGETLVTQNIEDNMVTKRALVDVAKLLPNSPSPEYLFNIYREGYRMNHALRSKHLVEIPVQNWMSQLLRRAIRDEPDHALVKEAIEIIVSSRASNAVPFKDAKPALKELRKRKRRLGVISNVSSHEVAGRILQSVGLERYFDQVITSAHTGIRKPDPGIFLYALMKLGISPYEALHVGDSEKHDVWGAKAVGIKVVLISRRGTPAKSTADYVFHNLSDALEVLQSQ